MDNENKDVTEETKKENKEEIKETTKEETKEATKEETKETTKEAIKEKTKPEVKEETKEETNDKPKKSKKGLWIGLGILVVLLIANGLPNEEHYTSAYDLAMIGRRTYRYGTDRNHRRW